MPLRLPAPDKTLLARSPLALVVCQLRFDEVLGVSDSRTMLAIQEALGGRRGAYPKAERSVGQRFNIQVDPADPAGATTSARPVEQGWRLSSSDGHWHVLLMPGYATLETTAYTNWDDDFRPRLTQLVDAIAEQVRPETEQRLGLRYVDRIVEPEVRDPRDWQGYIAPELLGIVTHEQLGPGVLATEQQVVLDVDDETRCGFRHGFFADPVRDQALTYVLDIDVYREGFRLFEPAGIIAAADAFNVVATQLFQAAITPELYALFATPKGGA